MYRTVKILVLGSFNRESFKIIIFLDRKDNKEYPS